MRILISEDDNVSRIFMLHILSHYGECDTAVDGKETLDAFKKAWDEGNPYNLICLDIMMPKMSGLEALRIIREIEKQKGVDKANRVKIIIVTALSDKNTVSESYDSGCEAFAWKPINIDNFMKILYRLGLISEIEAN